MHFYLDRPRNTVDCDDEFGAGRQARKWTLEQAG